MKSFKLFCLVGVLVGSFFLIQVPDSVAVTELGECGHYIHNARAIGDQVKKLVQQKRRNYRSARSTKNQNLKMSLREKNLEIDEEIRNLLDQIRDLKEEYIECCEEYREREGYKPGESQIKRRVKKAFDDLLGTLSD